MTVNLSSGTISTNTNMCTNMYGTTMANDYFGTQVFGSNPFGFQQPQVAFTTAPNDLASMLIQQHANSSNASSAPTMQDYVSATQIANMFSNQNATLAPYTSFTQNDIFAQQSFPMMFNNGQTIV